MYRLILVITITILPLLKNIHLKQDSIELHKNSKKIVIPYNNKNIVLPAGRYSFADSVIMYDPGARGKGTGDEPDARFQHPEEALGTPEVSNDSGFVSLGRGGTLILKFIDNSLIDEPGPDLCIFIRKQENESALVWVSKKGDFFQYVGTVDKDNPFIDLKSSVSRGLYQYVKIKDAYENSSPGIPDLGVDIDAVSAVNCAIKKIISSDLLFLPASSTLQDSILDILDASAQLIQSFDSPFVIIRAYSDGWGTSDYKLLLTQEQATAVRDYLTDNRGIKNAVFSVIGMGKQDPVASNDTDYGRKRNRRIEILIYPEK